MKDLEFSRNLSIGQYLDSGSPVHALLPGTKYWLLLCLMAAGLAIVGPAGAALLLVLTLGLGGIARVPASYLLRGLKPALPVFVLVALLQLLFAWPGDESRVLLALGPFAATAREAWIVLVLVLRSAILFAALGLFTSVTSESEAASGIEDSLLPLSRIGLPAHRLALAAVTAIRFVPILAGELETLAKAQASRGADFGSGRGGPIAKARAYLPLFVPLTIRALERAELLAEAMEARCYTGEGRLAPPAPRPGARERMIRLLGLALAAGLVVADLIVLEPRIRPY